MDFNVYPSQPWAKLLPAASEAARDLVSKLVCYESSSRLSAAEASYLGRVDSPALLMSLLRLDPIDILRSPNSTIEYPPGSDDMKLN